METFSDGVIAILLTIMVLELKVPKGEQLSALNHAHLWPVFFSYILSFVTIGIYWNNHHHMLRATERINGAVLWANLHLLFWLSLFSFATGWMGENHFARTPTAAYGVVLLGAGIAYYILQTVILRELGPGSALSVALGRDLKGKASPLIYTTGILLTFANHWLGVTAYAVVALMWLVPDRRLARTLNADSAR
jgi:uncharacterized membrane protein